MDFPLTITDVHSIKGLWMHIQNADVAAHGKDARFVEHAVQMVHQVEPGTVRISENHFMGGMHQRSQPIHRFMPRDDQRTGRLAFEPGHAVVALPVEFINPIHAIDANAETLGDAIDVPAGLFHKEVLIDFFARIHRHAALPRSDRFSIGTGRKARPMA